MIMLLSSVVLFSSYTTHKVVVRLFWSLLFLLFLIAAVVQPFQVTTSGAKRKSNTKSTKHREILLLRTTSRRMAASSSSKSSKSYPSEWIVSSLPLSSSSKKQKCNRNDGTTGHSTADDADGNNKDEKSKERHNILRRTHLVLHFDINDTILLGDAMRPGVIHGTNRPKNYSPIGKIIATVVTSSSLISKYVIIYLLTLI